MAKSPPKDDKPPRKKTKPARRPNNNGKLNPEQQLFVIGHLAAFKGPEKVAEMVKEEFGIEITRQGVSQYDPNTAAGAKKLSDRLKERFEAARTKYLDATVNIPIANKVWRLQQLQDMWDARNVRDGMSARAILKMASEEAGDANTNKRILAGTGKDGAIVTEARSLNDFYAGAAG